VSTIPPGPGQPNGHSADLPAGLRAVPGAAGAREAAQAAMAADLAERRQQAIHDQLAEMIEHDPARLLQEFPEMYGPVIASAVTNGVVAAVQMLQALPVRNAGLACAACMARLVEWEGAHRAEVEQARAFAQAAGQADAVPFLPEHLRPGAEPDGLPMLGTDMLTIIGGTLTCPQHHPAAAAAGGRLIAVPGISVHAAAQFAMGGVPGPVAG
jgi:hypothetical protein